MHRALPTFMSTVESRRTGQEIRERSFRFAQRIVALCDTLYRAGGVARLMAPQLLNSGTALYPMLEEARAAESRKDFIPKCAIGLKEIREAHGRLRLHEASNVGPHDEVADLRIEAGELVAIMMAIVGNSRANAGILPRQFKTPIPNS